MAGHMVQFSSQSDSLSIKETSAGGTPGNLEVSFIIRTIHCRHDRNAVLTIRGGNQLENFRGIVSMGVYGRYGSGSGR